MVKVTLPDPRTSMETHALQLEELNASAKIAPCGWSPVADRGKVFSPEPR